MSPPVLLELIATLTAGLFAGAALYINLVEHPARMTLDTKSAATEWATSYSRATRMQAPLALLSLFAGLASWWLSGRIGWAVAALLIGAVVPFTFIVEVVTAVLAVTVMEVVALATLEV